MRLRNFSILTLAAVLVLTSCKDEIDATILSRTNVPLEGSQEVPAKNTAANGTMDYHYNPSTKTLSYTVRWNSLTGNIIGFHIHGIATKGFNAPIVQNFSGYSTAQTGSFTGTFFVDGVAVKEEDLLRGAYYVNIHTPLNPGGEIRGQIVFE
jgi:hypothetical protein